MSDVNFPEWAGRLSSCLDMMLEADEHPLMTRESARRLAEEALREYRRVVPRQHISPRGDSRERAVPCSVCRTPTMALNGTCDSCDAKLDTPGLAS